MKRVFAVVLVLVLLAGLGVGLFLVQNPQIFKPKASCTGPGCVVEIGVTPTSVTKAKNEDFDLIVTVDTKGQEINGLQFVLKYPSDAADFESQGMELDPAVASAGWEKRISTQKTSGADKQIQFSATYNGSWNSNGTVNFAKITLKGAQDTTKTLTFDAGLSKATSGVNATDILVTPTSNTVVTIGGGGTAPTYYKCSGTSCVVDTTGGTSFANDPTCNNSCSATTKYYKCSGTSCVQDTSGATGFPNDNTCNNTCAATTKYGCNSAGSCVVDTNGSYTTSNCNNACAATVKYGCNSSGSCVVDSTGSYTTSNCNNACSTTPAPKYKCSGTACVRDDANGTYTATDCNGACASGGGTGGSTVVTPKITTITNGQKLTALPSKIEGTAKAYVKLTITLQSETVTATVNADASGKWVWYPQTTLEPGSHTLTVTDDAGNKTTVIFTILGASTGTGTSTTLPQSGVVENTILVGLAGLIFIAIGSILFHNL